MARGRLVVGIEGERALRRRLRTIEGGMQRLKDAHKDVAQYVQHAVDPYTPYRTGRLASTGRSSGTNTASIVRYGNNRSVPYAGVIHYGWPAHNIAAQPWVINHARSTEPVWVEIYNGHIRTLVEQTPIRSAY